MFKSRFMTKLLIVILFVISFSPALTLGYSYYDSLNANDSAAVHIGSWAFGTPISTVQEFYDSVTNTNSLSSDYYSLTTDLDFTGFTWNYDSSNYNVVFLGTLDGNGHTISNLTIYSNNSSYGSFGLFPFINGGSVKNITFDSVELSLGSSALNSNSISSGLIAGTVGDGNTTFSNITLIDSSVRGTSSLGTGGIVGNISSATAVVDITDIKVTGLKVFSTDSNAGGLVGSLDISGATLNISDIDLEGEVSAMASSSYTGGVIGNINSGSSFALNRSIIEVTSQNTLETDASYYLRYSQTYLGGIIGRNSSDSTNVTINNTFVTGALFTQYGNRYNYVGTAIGSESGSSTITNSYYSMVEFSDKKSNVVYTVDRPKGTMLPVVNDSTMPSSTWWNSYASNFLAANSLWAQDGTGRLYLVG